jgi:hypothetical protein
MRVSLSFSTFLTIVLSFSERARMPPLPPSLPPFAPFSSATAMDEDMDSGVDKDEDKDEDVESGVACADVLGSPVRSCSC